MIRLTPDPSRRRAKKETSHFDVQLKIRTLYKFSGKLFCVQMEASVQWKYIEEK